MQPNPPELDVAEHLLKQGKSDQAIPLLKSLVQAHPELPQPWFLLGGIGVERGELEAAEQNLQRCLALMPNHGMAHFQLGVLYASRGDSSRAVKAFKTVVDLNPNHVDALYNLAVHAVETKQHALAENSLKHATEILPNHHLVHILLSSALERQNKIDEAAAAISKACEINPNDPQVTYMKGLIEYRQNKFEEAINTLKYTLTQTDDQDIVERSHYTLALAYDRMDNPDEAFASLGVANAIDRQRAMSENIIIEGQFRQLERAHERLEIPIEPQGFDAPNQPVFFVGFPRSGTTLVEAMLDAHPDVLTTNERSPLTSMQQSILQGPAIETLSEDAWSQLRGLFWSGAEAVHGPINARLMVDKMPLNFSNLDIAARMFPQSKVLVALRDPRDVCLSCYMQHFARNPAMSVFTDLEDTGRLYDQVMSLWLKQREALPLEWMEYRYEDLIQDRDTVLGKILEFIGKDWVDEIEDYRTKAHKDEITTPSYAQVGEKLYTRAHGRWKRYEKHLKPILPLLEPYIKEFGYDL